MKRFPCIFTFLLAAFLFLGTTAEAQRFLQEDKDSVTAHQGGAWTNACTQSGTWDINDITGTVPLPTGAATAANQSTSNTHLSTLAGGVSGTEYQVDIVGAGALCLDTSVDGVEGLLTTIDTDTGNIDTSLNNIESDTSTLAGGVSGTEYQVDIVDEGDLALDSSVDGVEGLLGTIDTDTGNIDTNTTDIPNVIGTDNTTGPTRAIAIGGTESDGTFQEGLVDDDGHFQFDCVSGCSGGGGGGGTSSVDDAAFTAGTDSGTPAMGFFSSDTVDSGDVGVFAMDANRRQLVSIDNDNAGLCLDSSVDGVEGLLTTIDADTGNIDTSLNNIEADANTLAGAVSGTEVQVDIVDGGGLALDTSVDGIEALLTTIEGNQLADGHNVVSDTELPTAAALADNAANPTVPGVGSFAHWFDGTTWDRARGDSTNGLLCNLGANNDVTVAGVATAANQTTIIGHVDGIEGLLTTIDTDTGNIDTSLNNIETDADTLAGTVSGSEQQVDVVTSALPSGASTSANQSTIIGHVDGIEGTLGTIDTDTGNIDTNTTDLPNVIGTDATAGPTRAVSIGGTESDGTFQEGRVDGDGHWQVDILSGGGSPAQPSSSTLTNVNDSATSQQLLASNSSRLGAYIYNDSERVLYVKFGTTASTTSFTLVLFPKDAHKLDSPVYTGRIDGIWESDGSGAARITELE